MIPAHSSIVFKPTTLRNGGGKEPREGMVNATNIHGAFVTYSLRFDNGLMVLMKEFFSWAELAEAQVTAIGGLCE